MRAAVAESAGRLADVVSMQTVDEPATLREHEVAVRMVTSTVNPSDAVTVSGAYGSRTKFPFVPGFEGVGVVERIGAGVPPDLVGRRVLPIGSAGAWQQVKRTEFSWCVPVPDDLSDDAAGFAYINPLTAVLMTERFGGDDPRDVVITAAGSVIGGQLAELLNLRGIDPVGVVRRDPGRIADRSRWRTILATDDPEWTGKLAEATGGGADVVFDCVGGDLGRDLVAGLAPRGQLVHYGLLSGHPIPTECFDGRRGTRVHMFRLRDLIHRRPRSELDRLFAPVFDHLRAGRLTTHIGARTGLSALPAALARPGDRGKLLIAVQE
ncbi:NADPH:quinone reductase-like Zn-dependent oxidoreductase [Stackebrandtia endophytica]|uniref:NADPH:quinone reductase-like Zn-dependent oxidoreductase n=1 Tax=Stackebrandtia endophytica TaxID=1496996 RepID=A0A543B3L5_9ACTN|nr:zinc-dependent alcohol dehydrogenase family protein [Stackebrandtia endophytica]TQL79437.1 NADPH:quinone reductase-like Zn-dependent oxidoreductase [Stackebrandtia endophytica]